MTVPRVSVVIACHNYVEFLDEAIRSVLSQQGVEVDLSIVDDASTDGSVLRARAWAEHDPRVRLVVHDSNRGHIATFNEALAMATADYVTKLDPDDVLPPGALRRAADVLDAHPEVSFVYGHVVRFEGSTPTELPTAVRRVRIWTGAQWLAGRARRVRNVIYSPEGTIRRSALLAVGGHRAEIPASSDFNLWLRLATTGSVARIGGAVQGLYRVNPGSIQHTTYIGKLVDFRARRDAFDLFLADRGSWLADPERYRRTVYRALARDAVRLAFEELDDGQPAEPFLDEARALDPRVVGTVAWRTLARRLRTGSDRGAVVRVERVVRDVRARIRWRVWRRWGI